MNIIKAKVNFTKRTISLNGVDLTTGDYNSTKIEFEFDTDEGQKILEIKNPSDELIYADAIVNNEAVLVGKAPVTQVVEEVTYYKYLDNSENIYWYDKESDKLYNSSMEEVAEFDLDDYTQVFKDASLFTEPGKYPLEISLYGDDSKLSSASDSLKVLPEQVLVDDEIVEGYVTLFDELMTEITDKINQADNLNATVSKVGDTSTITITDKTGTISTATVKDGDKGDKGDTGATGATGNGISSISKTSTACLVDTYTITYTNGNTATFTVTNGQDGQNGADGADGYSPTASVSKSGSTATITITDKNGTTTATVSDGETQDLTDYVKNTDYATVNKGGVIQVSGDYGTTMSANGKLIAVTKTYEQYTGSGISNSLFISRGTLENVIAGKGLVSNTDYASTNTGGVVKTDSTFGVGTNASGKIYAVWDSYNTYLTKDNNAFVGVGTLKNVLTATVGDINSVLDAINGEVI